jgi:cytochrome c-type biogenesis protein
MTPESALTSFVLGLLAIASPCLLPLYPGFLAYLSGGQAEGRGRYFLGLFVLAGILTMMLLLGLVIALLSVSIGRALTFLVPAADLIIIGLGVLLLLDRNPFKALPQVRVPILKSPQVNAFVYGLLYGPIALPCSGPLVVGIFAYSLTAGEVLGKLGVFLWFGLGFGLPLLALSVLSGVFQRRLAGWLARHSRGINLAAGLLLLGVGVYDFAVNWASIRLALLNF